MARGHRLRFQPLFTCGRQTRNQSATGEVVDDKADHCGSDFAVRDRRRRTRTAADVTLRVTHEMAAQDAINIAAMRFAERVAERTGGQIDVKVFPAAQLGHDNDSIEQIKLGADLIVITQMAAAAPSEVPDLLVLDGPYLYDDLADYRTLIGSDWFDAQKQKLEQAGVKVLAANWLFGVRHTLADRPLRTPEDMQGLNIRIPPLAMWVETFEALGANGQTINFGEAYTALSSGVVDAIGSPWSRCGRRSSTRPKRSFR